MEDPLSKKRNHLQRIIADRVDKWLRTIAHKEHEEQDVWKSREQRETFGHSRR